MIYIFNSVQELLNLNTESLEENQIAQVFVCHEDGQSITMQYIWRQVSMKQTNGGTILNPHEEERKGRWELIHNGIGDFRYFGIFDEAVAADEALEAMVNDLSILKIEAFTPIRFTKRHKFYRSHLELDFHQQRISTQDIEPAEHNDPFSAIMHFKGRETNKIQEVKLTDDLKELYDIFEVRDASAFKCYEWWIVVVNNLQGREEKEIDKMLMVTEIIDETHIRVNYKMGWKLEKGRVLTYKKVEPIEEVNISNMVFWGNDGGEAKGAQPIALEYAVRCNVSNVQAYHTYWPVLLRRHNTHYVTEKCSLVNPVEVVVGGTGYLTQQIHCLYGKVRDCVASNARHLNDFTGSAYCMVENCHCDGDFHGAFVTHGQFEHDLTYEGNSGLISFANSGFTWGESAKRISVKRHVGCWLIAMAKVSDLTLEDIEIIKTEKYEQCGNMLLNVDGIQMRGCVADKLILTQRSSRSKRANIIQNCSFYKEGIKVIEEGEQAVTSSILYIDNLEREV